MVVLYLLSGTFVFNRFYQNIIIWKYKYFILRGKYGKRLEG